MESIVLCIGYVLIFIGRYKLYLRIDCRHSNSVPYCTSIYVSCNIYCSYSRIELELDFQSAGWSEGKTTTQASM